MIHVLVLRPAPRAYCSRLKMAADVRGPTTMAADKVSTGTNRRSRAESINKCRRCNCGSAGIAGQNA